MDRLKKNENIVSKFLQQFIDDANKLRTGVSTTLFVDKPQSTYIVITYGWAAEKFIHYVAFHLEVKADGVVWIYENRTNKSVVKELKQLGVNEKYIFPALAESYDEQVITA